MAQVGLGGVDEEAILKKMKENSEAWHKTTDPKERERLHQENLKLAKQIGLTYNPSTGTYSKVGGNTPVYSVGSSEKSTTSSKKSTTSTSPSPTTATGMIPLRQYFEDKDYVVQFLQDSGNIRIYDPKTGSSAMLRPGEYEIDKATGRAYIKDTTRSAVEKTIASGKYKYDPSKDASGKSGQGDYRTTIISEDDDLETISRKAYEQGLSDLQKYLEEQRAADEAFIAEQRKLLQQYIDETNEYMDSISEAGLELLRQYQEQYSQALEQMRQLMEPDPEVPESVKMALRILDEQLQENIRRINNELNARGVFNSTIRQRELQKAVQEISDEQRQVVNAWLENQHERMFQAALRLAEMQINYANNYANLYSQVVLQPAQSRINMLQNIYNMQSGLLSEAYERKARLAEIGFTVAQQLYQTFVEGIKEARTLKQQIELEKAKQEMEYQKWLTELQKWQVEQALKEAQLAETARHNRAMESIYARRSTGGTGSSMPSASLLRYLDEVQERAQQQQRTAQAIQLAAKLGTDINTANYILTYQDLIKQSPAAAKAQVESDKKAAVLNPDLAGVNFDFVQQYIDSLHTTQQPKPKSLWERIKEIFTKSPAVEKMPATKYLH